MYKNNDIYYIRYITIKDSDYVKINSINPLYLIINKVHGYIKEKNGNKYLTLISTDKNKEASTKYTELWDWIKNLIEKVNNKPSEYRKEFMKIKFNSDDNLPLNKTLKIHNMTIVLDLFLKKMVNIINKFFSMNIFMSYKNVTV